jgi:thiol-disulfide isomerase/thioredoxin
MLIFRLVDIDKRLSKCLIENREKLNMQKLFIPALLGFMLYVSAFAPSMAVANHQFVMKDLAGKQHKLSDYRGKWVLVNYWATWCPPCLEEVPDLVSLYHQQKKDVMVFGVVFDYETVASVKSFVDDLRMTYPVVLGDDEVAAQIGSADSLPTTYFYNPKGELVKIKRGLITKEYIENIIKSGK